MGSIQNFVNGVNTFQQNVGAVQGAADAMVPAIDAVGHAANQIASVFTGDTYQTAPYYPPAPMPVSLGGPKAGLVGSLLAGGTVGAITHRQTADALRSFKTDGIGAGLKNLGSASLKSGLIGGGVMGVVSGVKNFAAASRGEISNAAAGGNVAADTVGGILAGTGGGLTAGAVSMLLPGSGLLSTIGASAAGAVGALGVNMLFDGSGLRDKVATGVSNALGGTNNNYATTQNYYAPQQGYYNGY